MGERDIAAEVLEGLHEVREHGAGKRTLRVTRVEAKPAAELTPGMVENTRENRDQGLHRDDAARVEPESR